MTEFPVSSLDEATLELAISRARESLRSLEKQRSDLDRDTRILEAELKLLEQLLGLRRGNTAPSISDAGDDAPKSSGSRPSVANSPEATHSAVETVVSELAVVGRPVHISDLMRLLKEKRVRLPGAGAQANLIALLRRDERIMRPSRGMYALRDWGLTDMDVVPRARRRKIRRRVRVKPEDES